VRLWLDRLTHTHEASLGEPNGYPPQVRERLFQAFQGSTRPGGTGLGLAIAAELVRAHGGSIVLLPDGPGARFRITLPDSVPPPA
jgi:signal transduction histidine kinase